MVAIKTKKPGQIKKGCIFLVEGKTTEYYWFDQNETSHKFEVKCSFLIYDRDTKHMTEKVILREITNNNRRRS